MKARERRAEHEARQREIVARLRAQGDLGSPWAPCEQGCETQVTGEKLRGAPVDTEPLSENVSRRAQMFMLPQ